MSNFTDEQLADLRSRLHDTMLGFARMESGSLETLVRGNWGVAAQIEQLRRHSLVAELDDEVLAAIACRAIDPCVEARYLAHRVRGIDVEAASGAALSSPRAGTCSVESRPDLPPTVIELMAATIALIASDQLGFTTLEVRGRDHLDFRDCGVASVRAALIEAYEEGWHAAP